MEKYDGEFSILGMSVGLILGIVLKDLSAGIFWALFAELLWTGVRIYSMNIDGNEFEN